VVAITEKLSEVRRILDRYIVEVVERFDLCPWARSARLGGEVAIAVLWGEPSAAAWVEAGQALIAKPGTRVAMVVAPESAVTERDLRELRNVVTTGVPGTGVAHFHPVAEVDLATPPRLVPFLRRSPDPLLQLVPLSLLASVREPPMTHERVAQLHMLGGTAPPVRGDVGDMIAETNHARVSAELAAVTAALDSIAADRRETYARVGITSTR
jgi:hypothetical protein